MPNCVVAKVFERKQIMTLALSQLYCRVKLSLDSVRVDIMSFAGII